MNKLKGKKILIFQQRNWGKIIGRYLAAKLYKEGAELAALTFKPSTHNLIVEQPDIKYQMIESNDAVMSRPQDYLGTDNFSLAEICADLGIPSIWPIVSTLRNHVKSYGDKYYYSFKQNVPDDEIILYIKAQYKCLKKIFDQFKPDIILAANFVSFPHIMANLMAQRRGTTMIAMTDCKVQGIYIFSYNYQDSEGPFYQRLDELKAGATSLNQKRAKKYIEEFRQVFKKPDYANYEMKKPTWRSWIRNELSPYLAIARWYLKPQNRNKLESTGITLDYRPPRIILRDHYAEKRYRRAADRFSYYPLEKIKKFVYFPLQFQPEASIDVAAPFASNQIEMARLVAMSLPDDYTLVVKEHPGMVGKRSPSYHEKVARTVNVKLIDYRVPSQEVLRRADLVISPNSTTLAEAAFLNKPAIQLGDLGTTLLLPNVIKHTDMPSLVEAIKTALTMDVKSSEYEHRLENFVAAAYDTGLDIDYVGLWERGKLELREPLWQLYKVELESHFK